MIGMLNTNNQRTDTKELHAKWVVMLREFSGLTDSMRTSDFLGGGWDRCVIIYDHMEKIIGHLEKRLVEESLPEASVGKVL